MKLTYYGTYKGRKIFFDGEWYLWSSSGLRAKTLERLKEIIDNYGKPH